MKRKVLYSAMMVAVLVLLHTVALKFVSAVTTEGKVPAIQEAVLGWELTNARVVSTGIVSDPGNGILTTDYIVEADAKSLDNITKVKKGTFRTVFSVFSPETDMPGQKAGYWYLQGNWSVTDDSATDLDKKARHTSLVLRGQLSAVLPFNPLADNGDMQAKILLPYTLAGRDGIRGQGSFSGSGQFEGMLNINADIWPDVAKVLEVQ